MMHQSPPHHPLLTLGLGFNWCCRRLAVGHACPFEDVFCILGQIEVETSSITAHLYAEEEVERA